MKMLKMRKLMAVLITIFWVSSAYADGATGHTRKGQDPDLSTSEGMDLSDEDRQTSQTYVNEALGNKVVTEGCEALEDKAACQGRGETKFMGMKGSTVKIIAQAYSTVLGMMSMAGMGTSSTGTDAAKAGDKAKVKDVKGAKGTEGSEKDDMDYCALIAMGVETVGTAMQKASSDTLSAPTSGGNTDQKDTLYRASRSHADRAKTAKLQAFGWGATAVCYGVKMSTGAIDADWKAWLKLGASGLLSTFYFSEADDHEEYAKKVKEIADRMPNPGDCNPITDTECYCALDEYKNDPQYCVPYLHQQKIANGSYRIACTTDKLKADPKCDCIKTDSCFDTVLSKSFNFKGIGNSYLSSPLGKGLGLAARGQLSSSSITAARTAPNSAIRKLVRDKGDSIPEPKNGLSSEKNGSVKDLIKLGLPAKLSKFIAGIPSTKKGKAAIGRFSGAKPSRYISQKKRKSRNSVLRFEGGSGLRSGKKSSRSSAFNMNKFMRKKKKRGGRKGGKTWKFANKAMKSAQVSKNKEANIFNIISRRYMLSAKRRLEIE